MITAILLLTLVILVIAGLLLLLAILRRQRLSPPPPPPYKIPDQFNEAALASTRNLRLAGGPADGSQMPVGAAAPMKVIWVDKGDEVLVHLDSTQVRLLDGTLLFSVDLETDLCLANCYAGRFHLCLAKTQSAFEMHNIREGMLLVVNKSA